jgi:[ribosomal protein S5]-alanine N-acetyltransferase
MTPPDRKLRLSVLGLEDFRDTSSETPRPSARTLVRPLTFDDASAFVALAKESLYFHRKWIKLPTDPDAFERYLSAFDGKSAFCFVVCHGELIVGSVSLTGIEREPYQRGRLGYGVFEQYARMGYIAFGLKHVISFAFDNLGLHRLEADIQSDNEPSKLLIKKLDFKYEGLSRKFIRINNQWIDHERWALTFNE